jgi:hypothetical protein
LRFVQRWLTKIMGGATASSFSTGLAVDRFATILAADSFEFAG